MPFVHRVTLLAALAALLTCPARAQHMGAIRWQPTLETAKRVAEQTNRLVLIHFWADWCAACRTMDREVFTRPEVCAAINAGFVPVRLHADHFPQTARTFGVSMIPADVIVTPQGKVLGQISNLSTARDVQRYIQQLNAIASSRQGPANPYASVSRPAQLENPPRPTAAGAVTHSYHSPPTQSAPQMAAATSQSRLSPTNPPYASPAPGGSPQQPPKTAPTDAASRYAPRQPQPRPQSGPAAGRPDGPPPTAPPGQPSRPPQAEWAGQPPRGIGPPAPISGQPVAPQIESASAGVAPLSRQPGRPAAGTNPTASADTGQPAGSLQGAGPPGWLVEHLPPGCPPLALDGYCPVTLNSQEKWVLGDPKWGAIHEGRTYLFVGPEAQKLFLAAPEQYAPVLACHDVVLAVDEQRRVLGQREFGVWYPDPRTGRVFLFSSEQTMLKFHANPKHYLDGLARITGKPVLAAGNQSLAPANSPNQSRRTDQSRQLLR
ncbi:MAG TPA: DUF255 domain-containing protein [Planctomycetes bacterium]|nr:DUF255 domain-containing protein [Planctomycetota bacterium]